MPAFTHDGDHEADRHTSVKHNHGPSYIMRVTGTHVGGVVVMPDCVIMRVTGTQV